MGFPPPDDGYDLVTPILELGGDLPITSETGGAILEEVLGTYAVRGDLDLEVVIENRLVARHLHENLQQALNDEVAGDAGFFFHQTTGGVARVLGERVFGGLLLKAWAEEDGLELAMGEARREVEAGRLIIPSGIASDDVVVLEGGRVRAIMEVKASRAGFRYPIRSAGKALTQIVNSLRANPEIADGMFAAVDFEAHNAIVLRRHRAWWMKVTKRAMRAEIRRVHDNSTWPGAQSRRR